MGARAKQSVVSFGRDGSPERPLSHDELHHVLRNRRRRFALHHLKHAEDPVDVGELATQVAAWENRVERAAVTSKQRRRVYNALQQTHLPELDETGLVEVERREVALTDRAAELEIYTEVIRGNDFPWSHYYLALSMVTAGLLAAVWAGAVPFAALPPFAWAVFVLTAFFVSAVVHTVVTREMRLGGSGEPPELREDDASGPGAEGD